MESTDPPPLVVCDAGPLIHLDQLDSLDLLSDIGTLLVSTVVWGEVTRHRVGLVPPHTLRIEPALPHNVPDANVYSLAQAFSLDAGEMDTLALMAAHRATMFLTDDAAARLAATLLGYEVHGTIGILVRAIRRRLRTADDVLSLLDSIPQRSSLHVRPGLLQEVIASVKAGLDAQRPR